MHSIVFWNDRLLYFKCVDSNVCSFCKNEKENFYHIYCECNVIKAIWDQVIMYAKKHDFFIYNLDPKCILLNMIHEDSKHFLNLICLIVKHHVYVSKCLNQKPLATAIIKELVFIKKMEKRSAITKSQIKNYAMKWKENVY